MAIRIDAQELLEVLRLTPPAQTIMLIGKHGIGKSEIITGFYAQEKGIHVVAFFLGQMSDPGDLIGLMHKDEQSGRSVFLPPYWWPVDGQPIVLFLDELTGHGRKSCKRCTNWYSIKCWLGSNSPPGALSLRRSTRVMNIS